MAVASGAALFIACAGTQPPPAEPESDKAADDDADSTSDITMMAEVGALPEDAAIYAFKDAFEDIEDCFADATAQNELLSGDVAFFVEVNAQGGVNHVYAKESTLGDRRAERCMFDALRSAPWPKPVGGLVGVAENSVKLPSASDARPATPWGPERVQGVLQENGGAIARCKRAYSGKFTATAYIAQDGKALSVGIAPPNEDAEAASDCLVDVLQSASYPSPGSWPAKVSFQL